MIDFYLRFADQPSAFAALATANYCDDNGNPILANHSWALDALGDLVKTPAVLDANGNVVTAAVMSGYYHVNLRLLDDAEPLPTSLTAYSLAKPTIEKRVWAGS